MEIGKLLQRRALFFQRAFVKHLPDTTDLNPSPAGFFFFLVGVGFKFKYLFAVYFGFSK